MEWIPTGRTSRGFPYGMSFLITDVLMDFLMRRNRSRRLLDNYITANRIGHSRHVPGAVCMFSADVSILSVSHLHSFQQLLQCAPWAIAARSISLCSALHRPSQRNASAGGGNRHAQGQRFLWQNSPARLAPRNAIEPFSIHLSYGRQPAREGS